LQNEKIKLAYANLFSFSILLTQIMRCELSVNTGPFKNQNGWLKIAALGCTGAVIGLAQDDRYVSSVAGHREWLIHSTAVGAAIFLSIIIVTYLLGDSQPFKNRSNVFGDICMYVPSLRIPYH